MTVAMPVPDVRTILDNTSARPPQKCHTVDARGWALCRAFGPRLDANGVQDRSGVHPRSECRRRGHRHCVECLELERQFGDDGLMAA